MDLAHRLYCIGPNTQSCPVLSRCFSGFLRGLGVDPEKGLARLQAALTLFQLLPEGSLGSDRNSGTVCDAYERQDKPTTGAPDS